MLSGNQYSLMVDLQDLLHDWFAENGIRWDGEAESLVSQIFAVVDAYA